MRDSFIDGNCCNCWFNHEDIIGNQGDQEIIENMDVVENDHKSEMLQKLFEMVEKYIQQIILLENEIKDAKENFAIY